MKVWGVSYEGQRYGMAFDCPGCGLTHVVNIARYAGAPEQFPIWRWNGSQDAPTFEPSLLVRTGHHVTGQSASECNMEKQGISCIACHSFVRDGAIQFLGDCTHALAGQTIPLPEVAEGKAWDESAAQDRA